MTRRAEAAVVRAAAKPSAVPIAGAPATPVSVAAKAAAASRRLSRNQGFAPMHKVHR
jgi:hypothetical protein